MFEHRAPRTEGREEGSRGSVLWGALLILEADTAIPALRTSLCREILATIVAPGLQRVADTVTVAENVENSKHHHNLPLSEWNAHP